MKGYRAFHTLVLFSLSAASAAASEFRMVPSFAVSEEVNDNIREVPEGERLELVTRVQPGAALNYQAPYATLDASYILDYRYYARDTSEDQFNHTALLKGALRPSEDFFTLELSDSYSRVSLDPARETVQESVLVNQTDQNVATANPSLTWHPGGKSLLKTGYRFSDIRYWHSSAIDKQVHGLYADYLHQITQRLDFTSGYAFAFTDSELSSYRKHDLSAGLRYEYADRSYLYGGIGNSWLQYSIGLNSSNLFWNAGVSHDFGTGVASLETRVQYTEDPLTLATRQTDYTLKLDRKLERGRLWISTGYSEYQVELDQSRDRERVQINLGGSHELGHGFTAGLSALGERLSRHSAIFNLPYHLVGTGTLSYLVSEGFTLGVSYSHISYRDELGDSSGSIEVNRGLVEVRKVF